MHNNNACCNWWCNNIIAIILGHSKLIHCFSSPLSQKNRCGRAAGNGRLFTSLMGNGRQNHKFSDPKNRGGILLYCAGAGGNTCGRKSRGDEKQLINLEWPYSSQSKA